jgi:hypothetical protein
MTRFTLTQPLEQPRHDAAPVVNRSMTRVTVGASAAIHADSG